MKGKVDLRNFPSSSVSITDAHHVTLGGVRAVFFFLKSGNDGEASSQARACLGPEPCSTPSPTPMLKLATNGSPLLSAGKQGYLSFPAH